MGWIFQSGKARATQWCGHHKFVRNTVRAQKNKFKRFNLSEICSRDRGEICSKPAARNGSDTTLWTCLVHRRCCLIS